MAPFFTGIAKGSGGAGGFGFGRRRGPRGPALSVTGGTFYNPGNGYKYHVFTYPNSSNLVISGAPPTPGWAYVLLVGGGGAGSSGLTPTPGSQISPFMNAGLMRSDLDQSNDISYGGNGGAYGGGAGGGVLTGQLTLTDGTYPISVGNGASFQGNFVPDRTPKNSGPPGGPTTAFGATANGGDTGFITISPSGHGGSSLQSPVSLPYGNLTGSGNNYGASRVEGQGRAGGGGGAGGPGGQASGGIGIGISWMESTLGTPGPNGALRYFAGGGGGYSERPIGGPYPGGYGGGGHGGANSGGPAGAGINGTGGGGGGGNHGPEATSQPGGSGIVVIAYPDSA